MEPKCNTFSSKFWAAVLLRVYLSLYVAMWQRKVENTSLNQKRKKLLAEPLRQRMLFWTLMASCFPKKNHQKNTHSITAVMTFFQDAKERLEHFSREHTEHSLGKQVKQRGRCNLIVCTPWAALTHLCHSTYTIHACIAFICIHSKHSPEVAYKFGNESVELAHCPFCSSLKKLLSMEKYLKWVRNKWQMQTCIS